MSPVPANAKRRLEAVASLKNSGASAGETKSAARFVAQVADDTEVPLDVRAEATLRRRELEAAAVQEDATRREAAMSAAQSFASRNT